MDFTTVMLALLVVGLVVGEFIDWQPPHWFFYGVAGVAGAAAVYSGNLPAILVLSVMAVLLVRKGRRWGEKPPAETPP